MFFHYKKIAFRIVGGIAAAVPLDTLIPVRIAGVMAFFSGKHAMRCIISPNFGQAKPQASKTPIQRGAEEEWVYITSGSLRVVSRWTVPVLVNMPAAVF